MTSLPNDFTKMSEQELQTFIAEHPDIDLNAKLSSRYFRDLTPIQIAIRARNSELVSVLLSHNVNLTDAFVHLRIVKRNEGGRPDCFWLSPHSAGAVSELLKKAYPNEWEQNMSKEAVAKRQIDGMSHYLHEQYELEKQGAVRCTRCHSLFFEDNTKEQPPSRWKFSSYPDFDNYLQFLNCVCFEDWGLDHDTVCLGHKGEVQYKRISDTFRQEYRCWTCCGFFHDHLGCIQYKEHTLVEKQDGSTVSNAPLSSGFIIPSFKRPFSTSTSSFFN